MGNGLAGGPAVIDTDIEAIRPVSFLKKVPNLTYCLPETRFDFWCKLTQRDRSDFRYDQRVALRHRVFVEKSDCVTSL